jgi:hypothetical protein
MSNSLPIEWEFFYYLYFLYNFSDYYGLISSQQSRGLYVARIHSDILNFVRRIHDIQFWNTFIFEKKIYTHNYHARHADTLMTPYKIVRCASNEKITQNCSIGNSHKKDSLSFIVEEEKFALRDSNDPILLVSQCTLIRLFVYKVTPR